MPKINITENSLGEKTVQSRATKQSPEKCAGAKRFQNYTAGCRCIACGNDGGVICDHLWGRSKKTYVGPERVHIGHWAVIPLCVHCDRIKTMGSRRAFESQCGSQKALWALHASGYHGDIPDNVKLGIANAN